MSGGVRIKVCCIQDRAEVELARRHGASAVGFVSRMPSGPGVVDDDVIRDVLPRVPEAMDTFLLTSETEPARIAEGCRSCGPWAVQLVDRVPAGAYGILRSELPGVRIVQVVHVTGPESVAEALELAPEVDMLLLDSGRPEAPIRELGGTGRTHDWSLSREIRERVEVPVWLAGGLDPDNVAEAVRTVRPYGVDVCSGLRPDGALDEALLARFVGAVRTAT